MEQKLTNVSEIDDKSLEQVRLALEEEIGVRFVIERGAPTFFEDGSYESGRVQHIRSAEPITDKTTQNKVVELGAAGAMQSVYRGTPSGPHEAPNGDRILYVQAIAPGNLGLPVQTKTQTNSYEQPSRPGARTAVSSAPRCTR